MWGALADVVMFVVSMFCFDPLDNWLIFRPDRSEQIWRFFTYMVLHSGWLHLGVNVVSQLLVGLPLEMVQSWERVSAVYVCGVLSGSLATAVFDHGVCLVGSSSGVYSLLAAHLANVSLNYHKMEFGLLSILGVLIIGGVDTVLIVYDRFALSGAQLAPSVSYLAHLAGALSGLTVGLGIFRASASKRPLAAWISLGVALACFLFLALMNVFR
ncbi:RHBDL3 [Cordylochernes scorpioides]|uniref:RHBDL3 n=1 Tax=Cordylochernes scorpioides TaxID=51811 RepID=A0ABY6LQE6_9ARAC|nr:RHBDL3 [Cordylochernes scorpioides]